MKHGKSNFGVVKWNLVEHCLALLNYYRWSTLFSVSHSQSRNGHSNDKASKSKNRKLHHLTNLNCIPSISFDYIIQMHSFQLGHLQQQKLPNSNLHCGYSPEKKSWCFPLKINEAKKSSTLSKHRRINHFENAYSEDFSNRRWTENYSVPKASAVCFINYSNLLVIMTSFMGFVWENFPSWIQMICDRDFRWLYWKRRGDSYQMSCCCFYFFDRHCRCRCHNNECYHIKCEVVNRRDPCYTQTNS